MSAVSSEIAVVCAGIVSSPGSAVSGRSSNVPAQAERSDGPEAQIETRALSPYHNRRRPCGGDRASNPQPAAAPKPS